MPYLLFLYPFLNIEKQEPEVLYDEKIYVFILSSSAFIGILLSVLAGTPVGSTIVVTDMAAFLVSCVVERFMGR